MSNGNTFSRLFGQSPFTALQEHMGVVLECAREVLPLIEALVASVLLGVGVVGLMSAGTLAVRNQRQFEYRTAAMCLAQEKLAEVEVVGPNIWTLGNPDRVPGGRRTFQCCR